MMENIQSAYSSRKPSSAVKGSPVIALFPEDNVLYRAVILENQEPSYKVQYVDFGNTSSVTKVWPIETKFMQLPTQAICCALADIKCKDQTWPDADCFSSYFEKETFLCNFIAKDANK